MDALTLVPNASAKPGFRFTFQGDPGAMECEGCPVRGLCFRIPTGRRYEVTAVRKVVHPCELHDEGQVTVCTVKEIPFTSSVKAGRLRGTAAPWEPIACGTPECPSFGFCHPVGFELGKKMEIVADEGFMECPAGFDLHRVQLRPMRD